MHKQPITVCNPAALDREWTLCRKRRPPRKRVRWLQKEFTCQWYLSFRVHINPTPCYRRNMADRCPSKEEKIVF